MQKQKWFAGVFVALFFILTTSCNRVGGQIGRDYSVDETALGEGTPLETAVHLSAEDFTVIRDFGEPPADVPVVIADSSLPPDDAEDAEGRALPSGDDGDQDEEREEQGQPPQDGDHGRRHYSDGDKDDKPSLGKLKKDADFLACGDIKKVLKYFYFKEGKPDDNFYQWLKKNRFLLQKKACLALKLKDQPDKHKDKKDDLLDKKDKFSGKPKKPTDVKEDDQQYIPQEAVEEIAVILYGSFQVNGSSPDDDDPSLHLASWGGSLSTGTGPSGHFVVGTPHYYQVATGASADDEDTRCAPEVVSLASYHPSNEDCTP